jgi:leucyl aminopeptidase
VQLAVTAAPVADVSAQVLVVPVMQTPDGPRVAQAVSAAVREALGRTRFAGADNDFLLTAGPLPGIRADAVALIGMGEASYADQLSLRRAVTGAIRDLGRFERVAVTMPDGFTSVQDTVAVADAVLDGWYRRQPRRSGAAGPRLLEEVTIIVTPSLADQARAAVADAQIIGDCVSWARALIDSPAAELTPATLAEAVLAMGAEAGLEVRVRPAAELREQGFGGILAVGGGSANPPCLIEATHRGAGQAMVGLAGKGITFDAGGLFIKTGTQMLDMKSDMAGAATMLATARAAALLGLPAGVHAVAPAAENLPSGTSYKPGDVITHYGGLTSEVADTDSEGRVVLADTLAYLAGQRPAAIVDAATLTYSVIQALGDQVAGILGDDDNLVANIVAAGQAVGEPWWRLPLWRDYRRNIDSPVADVRNDGGGPPDVIHAALFLAEFTGDVPWAHLDIAGTAYRERDSHLGPAGATGAGIRTLVRWLRDL